MRYQEASRLMAGEGVWVVRIRLTLGIDLHVSVSEGVVADVAPERHVALVEVPDGEKLAATPFAYVYRTKREAIDDAKRLLFRLRYKVDTAVGQLTRASSCDGAPPVGMRAE